MINKSIKKYNLILVITYFILFAIENSKANTIFEPLIANPYEARIGSLYSPNNDKMRLDIGASYDFMEILNSDGHKLNFGSDFMTYTRLRSEGKMKFPVETSDYFFGVNFTGMINLDDNNQFEYRVRVAHISSHLIDGYTKLPEYTFLQKPFVYSREFVDLVIALRVDDLRVYGGVNSVFSTQPRNITRFIPQAGLDYRQNIANNIDIIGGYDVKLLGVNSILRATNSIQLGVKHQEKDKAGIFVGLYYFTGPSIHGMFYDKIDNYLGFGFQIIP